MSLYQKIRPTTFDGIAGAKNKEVVSSMRQLAESDAPPHAVLIVGESGCGKTTLGRIYLRALGVADDDYREIDTAEFRGIDTVRELRRSAHYKALGGDRRGWLLDECFASSTLVSTPLGAAVIESIRPGDIVYTLKGPSKVRHTFRNVVVLDRIVRLSLSDGKVIFTTVDHLFFRGGQWMRAASLAVNDLLYSLPSDIMQPVDLAGRHNAETTTDLSGMRDGFSFEEEEAGSDLLLSEMRSHVRSEVQTIAEGSNPAVPGVWEKLRPQEKEQWHPVLHSDLRAPLRWQETDQGADAPSLCDMRQSGCFLSGSEEQQADVQSGLRECPSRTKPDWDDPVRGVSPEVLRVSAPCTRSEYRARVAPETGFFGEDEKGQSFSQAGSCREGAGYEADQRNSPHMEWGAGRKWKADGSSEDAVSSTILAYRGCDTDGVRSGQRVSDLLQGRCGELGFEDCNRDRWQDALDCPDACTRREEDREIDGVRVASVEVYKRGYNDEHFGSVIGGRERSCGYAIFYDLEVEGDPSYFAEGVAVHNCHRWTKDSMEGMLKGLEDPPPHAFYVLCTTDPEKLLPTILSRCVQFRVHPLDEAEMVRLLHRAASGEGTEVSRVTLQKIAEASRGRPRAALNMLQKLIADPTAGADALVAVEQVEARAIDLYNAMMRDQGWKAARSVLADLKAAGDDPEAIRRFVLACCSNELLKKESDRTAVIMEEFINPFYDTGFPGLVFAVYSAIRAGQ